MLFQFVLLSSRNIKGQQVVEMETVSCKPSFVNMLLCRLCNFKVENILTGSLDSIPSPSPSVKIQIMGKFSSGVMAKHCWALLTNV